MLSKANVGLYGLWTAIYIALAVYLFIAADLTGAGINVVSRAAQDPEQPHACCTAVACCAPLVRRGAPMHAHPDCPAAPNLAP